MQWIEFNGTRSDSLGLIVVSMPAENRAAMRYSTNSPYGVDGDLLTVEPGYSSYKSSVSFNCLGRADHNDIYRWLTGSGWMTTSDDPTKHRWVSFVDEQTNSRLRYNFRNYDTITVPMICAPFKYLIDEEPITVTSSGMVLDSNVYDKGDVPSRPLIEMKVKDGYTRDTITVNGTSIHIVRFDPPFEEVPVIMDSLSVDNETKYSYVNDSGDIRSSFEYGLTVETDIGKHGTKWIELSNTADNTITYTAGIDNIKLYPRRRWF